MSTLYIVATPIGNLEDITIRAIRTLFGVDVIACEDTRRTGMLLANLESRIRNKELVIGSLPAGEAGQNSVVGNKPTTYNLQLTTKCRLISYYDEVEEKRLPELIGYLEEGKDIALVSDAGTPLISDPGYKLVQECIKRNIPIVSIPGPTSYIAALTVSGLPPNHVLFLGYVPEKDSKRKMLLQSIKDEIGRSQTIRPTVVFFESPHRIKESLEHMKGIYGDIEVVVVRELTKIHEEVLRGPISKLLESPSLQSPKGEFVLLFRL